MKLQLIAVPYDSGVRGIRMGAGPEHLLNGGLASRLSEAGHEVDVAVIEAPAAAVPAEVHTAFGLLAGVSAAVRRASDAGRFPILLSGSCYATVGALAGLGADRTAVLWFDSHADFNTPETTVSGFLDGMAVTMLTGRCWRQLIRAVPGFEPLPDGALLLCGIRDVDPLESELLDRSGIEVLTPERVRGELDSALGRLSGERDHAYLHIDLDVIDPSEGRANWLAAPDGLLVRELEAAATAIGRELAIRGLALTAYDPECDPEGRVRAAAFDLIDAVLARGGM